MAIEAERFRIIPDPSDEKLWAYQILSGHAVVREVGGFRSSKDARRAADRALKQGGDANG